MHSNLQLAPFTVVKYRKMHFGSHCPGLTVEGGHTGSGGHGFPKIQNVCTLLNFKVYINKSYKQALKLSIKTKNT